MKSYPSLSKAIRAIFRRHNHETIAIVSLNGRSYFVCRSTPSERGAKMKTVDLHREIKKELARALDPIHHPLLNKKGNTCQNLLMLEQSEAKKFNKFRNYFTRNGLDKTISHDISFNFDRAFQNLSECQVEMHSVSLHAEERVILKFPEMIDEFKKNFPDERITTLDIFLTQSPCSEKNDRYSSPKILNGLKLSAGCDNKLSTFFGKQLCENYNKATFDRRPKVRIRYHNFYKIETGYTDEAIQKMDPQLQDVFARTLA